VSARSTSVSASVYDDIDTDADTDCPMSVVCDVV